MKNTFRLIFSIFIGLLVLAAIAAFFSRQAIKDWVNAQNSLDQLALKETPAKSVSLDTTILKSPKFLSFKNNVTNFDFDSICKRPALRTAVIETKGQGTATSSPTSPGCVLGNNAPIRN